MYCSHAVFFRKKYIPLFHKFQNQPLFGMSQLGHKGGVNEKWVCGNM